MTYIRHFLMKFGVLCLASLLFISGCEEPFQPIEENHEYFFSVYGYLGSEADTQWVRVMPVRETTEYSDEPIDATVTLENLDTGEITTMNDSLFTLSQVAEEDAYVWNFWTTTDIHPSNTYKLKVERSDGAITTATVDIPGQFADPTIDFNYVEVYDVNNLAEVLLNWKVRDRRDNTIHEFSVIQDQVIYYRTSEKYRIVIYPNDDFVNVILKSLEASQPQIEILDTKAVVSVAGSDWVDFSELGRDVIALPEATSNIENGVGYLVGSIRKVFSYPVCVGDHQVIISCQPDN
ncbi:hypothetical protein [Gracilimonas sp.]|uniref:hypothetical protein n=1 Tax=Gracilimonas sp. TaxID=1974203 RepID=UPI0028714E34|nr:hypothetical protein [Gracilimonas sp.]